MTNTNELLVINSAAPQELYANDEVMHKTLSEIEEYCLSFTEDVTTPEGRKNIASLAYRISRTKTAIDDAGKVLGEDWHKKWKAITSKRKVAKDQLDTLRDKVRAPLTEFENAEKARITEHDKSIEAMKALKDRFFDKSSDIEDAIIMLDKKHTEREWEEFAEEAKMVKDSVLSALEQSLENVRKQEADRAELEELRKHKEEAERKERERLEAEQRAEREKKIAEEAAEKERKRVEKEMRDKENERLAKEEEAKRIAEKEEADKERARLAKEEAEKKRQADESHRANVRGQSIDSVVKAIANKPDNKEIAAHIVDCIIDGKIPNLTINF